MIVTAGAAIGFGITGYRKKRIDYLSALIYLINHISFKITYFRSEISVIFDDYSNDFLRSCGFLDLLHSNGLGTALSSYNDRFNIREYEKDALMNLSDMLGKSSWEDQVKMCSALNEIIENYLVELKEKYPEERKLFSSLGIIAGLLVAVVLI